MFLHGGLAKAGDERINPLLLRPFARQVAQIGGLVDLKFLVFKMLFALRYQALVRMCQKLSRCLALMFRWVLISRSVPSPIAAMSR